jgi:5'-nucleotidase
MVPMDTHQLWEATFEKRLDPMKRPYYWYVGASGLRQVNAAVAELTDVKAVGEGHITITPLQFDRTDRKQLERMNAWKIF